MNQITLTENNADGPEDRNDFELKQESAWDPDPEMDETADFDAVYSEGYMSCCAGEDISENPYEEPDQEFDDWTAGWLDAQLDRSYLEIEDF